MLPKSFTQSLSIFMSSVRENKATPKPLLQWMTCHTTNWFKQAMIVSWLVCRDDLDINVTRHSSYSLLFCYQSSNFCTTLTTQTCYRLKRKTTLMQEISFTNSWKKGLLIKYKLKLLCFHISLTGCKMEFSFNHILLSLSGWPSYKFCTYF